MLVPIWLSRMQLRSGFLLSQVHVLSTMKCSLSTADHDTSLCKTCPRQNSSPSTPLLIIYHFNRNVKAFSERICFQPTNSSISRVIYPSTSALGICRETANSPYRLSSANRKYLASTAVTFRPAARRFCFRS